MYKLEYLEDKWLELGKAWLDNDHDPKIYEEMEKVDRKTAKMWIKIKKLEIGDKSNA